MGVVAGVGDGVVVFVGVRVGAGVRVVAGVGDVDGVRAEVADCIRATRVADGVCAGVLGSDVGVAGGIGGVGVWVAAIVGVVVGVGDCVAVGIRVGIGVMNGLAVVVGVWMSGLGSRATPVAIAVGVVADGVGAAVGLDVGAGMVAVGMVGVGGCRSDSRMIVNVGVGCGMTGVAAGLGWMMGAGEVGAPPHPIRVSSRVLAIAWARAARIGLGGYLYEGGERVLGGDFAYDGAGLDAGVGEGD